MIARMCTPHSAKIFMKLSNKPHASANFVLSCEENKRLATFVELLLVVDRRVKAQAAVAKQQRVKAKHEKKGSQKKAGPFYFTRRCFMVMLNYTRARAIGEMDILINKVLS
jgi:hypothetical protein